MATPGAELDFDIVSDDVIAYSSKFQVEEVVEEEGRHFCVKRALAKLRVKADWRVPVERNAYEAAWLKDAARLAPGSAPRILAEDPGETTDLAAIHRDVMAELAAAWERYAEEVGVTPPGPRRGAAAPTTD